MARSLESLIPSQFIGRLPASLLEFPVLSVTSDSRAAGPGAIFVAVRGTSQDGHRFIGQAAQNGAVLIVGNEKQTPSTADLGGVPYLGVPDEREFLGRAAAAFYDHPSYRMQMIGVTGTSGKTTTTYLIDSILRASLERFGHPYGGAEGGKVGLIGTVEFRSGLKRYPSTHTTPGPVELQRLLSEMLQDGCRSVVMEVSSHALKQHRTAGIAFDGMVFTNITPEHLDFHPDMEDYFFSKALLFGKYAESARRDAGKNPVAVINVDDAYGQKLSEIAKRSGQFKEVLTYGTSLHADLSSAGFKIDAAGISGNLKGIEIRSPMVGTFNALNLIAAAGICRGLGIPDEAISIGLKDAPPPPGRLERVPDLRSNSAAAVHVIVDYAHKPDALEKVLETLSSLKKPGSRLITVFGCGGDRDRQKRPVMGALAARWSDRVWVTSDNPRTEDPRTIVQEIVGGMNDLANVSVEIDRREAILSAISWARPGDWVLIAGKGHEDYQIISDPASPSGTRKIHFDDREVAAEALKP